MKSLNNIIRPTIEELNLFYGKGDVGKIEMSFGGKGTFEQLSYGMKPQKRKFRTIWNGESFKGIYSKLTIFALRHRKTIKSK